SKFANNGNAADIVRIQIRVILRTYQSYAGPTEEGMHMAFGMRAALRPIVVLFVALLSANASGADARETTGVPKSAPAFTKFMAEFIREAMPQAKIATAGR